MNDFMVVCVVVIAVLIMAMICFQIAKSKKVQRLMLETGNDWILGQVDETIIEEMEKIAIKAYENQVTLQTTLVEASEKYTVVTTLVNGCVEKISVKYQTATVTKSKEGIDVQDIGVHEENARIMTGTYLFLIMDLIALMGYLGSSFLAL